MKTLGIVFMILVLPAAGFGQQYPMLEDVRAVSVSIDHVGTEPNDPAINWPKMQLQLAKKVSEVGISIEPVKGIRLPGIPDLDVTVMMVAIPETEQFVFHIETALYRLVNIPEKSNIMFTAPVWEDLATMQTVAADEIEAAVTKAASRQVGKFIEAWQAAQKKNTASEPNEGKKRNPPAAAANQRQGRANESDSPAQTSTVQSFAAAKSSKIFHKADCSTAKNISQANLVIFASRQEAISSGRRPCKMCNP